MSDHGNGGPSSQDTAGSLRLGGPVKAQVAQLDPLADLVGKWTGHGFNVIWRPHFNAPAAAKTSDHFLALNLTSETLEFTMISTEVPNRGGNEADVFFPAVDYLQQISDANFRPPKGGGALHFEPGIWISFPATTDTGGATVNRMGTIPHGNAILLEGTATAMTAAPAIPAANVLPFPIGNPSAAINTFAELDLSQPQTFRNDPLPTTITAPLLANPNSLLTADIAKFQAEGFTTTSGTLLEVGAAPPKGGIESIPFLAATTSADVAEVKATFWIEEWTKGTTSLLALQYSQTVLLNFKTLSWPHVTVGSLVKPF